MAMEVRKAQRKKAKMRVGVTAPSGGGKTFSALKLARGLASAWSAIVLIDTESGSGELYSHLGGEDTYGYIRLDAPYSPERYIEAIEAAEQAGAEVIIIDSATHEWDGVGGCLEIADKATAASRSKNSYTEGWRNVTPRHQKFLARLIASRCHIITTTRRKQDYDMSKDSNGRTTVTKVGLKEVQRDGFEYELTLNFELDMAHQATAAKDRTELFDARPPFVITEDTGRELMAWCESGAQPKADEPAVPPPTNGHSAEAKAASAITITNVEEKAYSVKGEDRTGYVVTLSDGRVTRIADETMGEQAKVYRDNKNPLAPTVTQTDNGKLMLVEFGALDQPF